MNIFPAIDIFKNKAVRLMKGDYGQMKVYSEHPLELVKDFGASGARFLHVVDLEGAKLGRPVHASLIKEIVDETSMFVQVGGGIRNMESLTKLMESGVNRAILGTAALLDRDFLEKAIDRYPDKIAVGVDIKDGFVAVSGWTEKSDKEGIAFCKELEKMGVRCIICTDISKDGMMQGVNASLYESLMREVKLDIIASGGVTNLEDIRTLSKMNLYGAIVGKAYYEGAVRIADAIRIANDPDARQMA